MLTVSWRRRKPVEVERPQRVLPPIRRRLVRAALVPRYVAARYRYVVAARRYRPPVVVRLTDLLDVAKLADHSNGVNSHFTVPVLDRGRRRRSAAIVDVFVPVVQRSF